MKVAAYIPVKLNNERLPGKNLLPLGDKLLCDYIFSTLQTVARIDARYVFCSDDRIKAYLPEGIIFLKRDASLDRSAATTMEIIRSFIEKVYADVYILTHVTSPFLRAGSIATALGKVLEEGYDSAFCVERLQSLCWFGGQPLNYDVSGIPRTQELEPVFVETNGFYIFKREVAVEQNSRIGANPYLYEVGHLEAADIDTGDDYEFAKLAVRLMGSEVNR